MSDDTAPETAEPAEVQPAAKKRRLWPYIVGGAVVLALVVTGAVLGALALLATLGGDPAKTVTDYDLSFKNSDCDLFTSTTTEQFQNDFFGGEFDCDAFVKNADALTIEGEYSYDVTVVISSVDGDTAEVVTNEADTSTGESVDFTLRYRLVHEGGRWLVDAIDNETPESSD